MYFIAFFARILAHMGVEISREFCWGAVTLAGLTGIGVFFRAWLGRGNEYREKILQEQNQGDEADLVAGRAVMIASTDEDLKSLARDYARELTEEYNKLWQKRQH